MAELEWWKDTHIVKLAYALPAIPLWEYCLGASVLLFIFLYTYLDIQLLHHLFLGDSVNLVHSKQSPTIRTILSKLKFQRFWPTPWLCSAHLQTLFLHFLSSRPAVNYRRELLKTPDGGTIAMDWSDGQPLPSDDAQEESDGSTPVVLVIPGLTSDSNSQYVLHLVRGLTDSGWRAVVVNHRGLGGIKLTSRTFYNAGWTVDLDFALNHVKSLFPTSPLLAVGTSLGSNILVKYLGEKGANVGLRAAVAIGCPWDLVVCDRWLHRLPKQKAYGMGMAAGLNKFALSHKDSFSQLVNMKHLTRSKTVREFDDRITRLLGNFETVDTYYRRCSSAQFLPGVAIPLLAISAMDDPICTAEAIPWDECRANPNVLLAVTAHGGHLAYFEGWLASRIWWVKQSCDYFKVVLSSLPVPASQSDQPAGPDPVREVPVPGRHLLASQSEDVVAGTAANQRSTSGEIVAEEQSAVRESGGAEGSDQSTVLTVKLKSRAELVALEGALVQLLDIIKAKSGSGQSPGNGSSALPPASVVPLMAATSSVVNSLASVVELASRIKWGQEGGLPLLRYGEFGAPSAINDEFLAHRVLARLDSKLTELDRRVEELSVDRNGGLGIGSHRSYLWVAAAASASVTFLSVSVFLWKWKKR